MIDWDKGPFTGRRALAATKANGSSLWALVGLAVEGNIPVGGSPIYRDDQTKVDCVTAAAWSPAAKCNIASAQVRRPHDRKGELMVEVSALHALQYAKLMLHARVCPRPFFAPARRRGTPPGRF